MLTSQTFLSSQEREQITAAIRDAEGKSPGEIRVFFEKHAKVSPLDRAVEVFRRLKMDKTNLRTGILIYVAYQDKTFAILGDEGIHQKVPENFWDETKRIMEQHFMEGRFVEGLKAGIQLAGEQLSKHFKASSENPNELSDDIIIEDE